MLTIATVIAIPIESHFLAQILAAKIAILDGSVGATAAAGAKTDTTFQTENRSASDIRVRGEYHGAIGGSLRSLPVIKMPLWKKVRYEYRHADHCGEGDNFRKAKFAHFKCSP